ncbi:MAG: glycerol-3-phosphate 1-O-acyltransferase PlsY [Phycisphaeraceae bacterium]
MTWIAWLIAAYLVGAIPFGYLIGRLRGVDLRSVGSGNVGATNVGRVLGRRLGIACFLLDVGKGLAPVLAYGHAAGLALARPTTAAATTAAPAVGSGQPGGAVELLIWLAIAAAAVVGHIFPVYLGFRGGKGVATGLGVLLGFWPVLTLPGLGVALLWLAVVRATAYVSLASIVAAVALPAMTLASAWLWGRPASEVALYLAVTLLLALLVVLRHRDNIARLRAGTEAKVAWTRR